MNGTILTIPIDRSGAPTDQEVANGLADSAAVILADIARRTNGWDAIRRTFAARVNGLLIEAQRKAGPR